MNRSIEAAAREVRDTGRLKSGAIPLSQIIMQSVTSIGPARGVFATFQPGVSLAGVNAPLVYLADILIVLMLGSTLVHLSRAFPSAGGYFTYVSRTLSPRAGLLVSWAYVIYSALMPGVLFAYLGRILQLAQADIGIHIHWTILFAASAVVVGLIIYRGIEFSGLSMMVIGLVRCVIDSTVNL
jgi:amino acid transporter